MENIKKILKDIDDVFYMCKIEKIKMMEEEYYSLIDYHIKKLVKLRKQRQIEAKTLVSVTNDRTNQILNTLVKYLVSFDANDITYMGKYPLFHLVLNDVNKNYSNFIRAFIEVGADINIKDYHGNTILHKIFSKKYKFAKNFLKILANSKDIDLNAQNNWGETPLHVALKHKRDFGVIKPILEAGANWKIRDNLLLASITYADKVLRKKIARYKINYYNETDR